MKTAISLLFAVFCAVPAAASSITYQWEGDGGIAGFFTLDSTAFTTIDTRADVPQTALTAFFFSGPGFTFDFADVVPGSAVVFDTTVTPPAFFDGAGGDAARDAAGNRLDFFGSEFGASVGFFPVSGERILSSGRFVVAPEPAYWPLLSAGLLAVFAARSRFARFRRSNFNGESR